MRSKQPGPWSSRAPDSLVAISPDGRTTNVNKATVKATGILHEELIGPRSHATILGAFAAALPGGGAEPSYQR
jgi:hypothetical protein